LQTGTKSIFNSYLNDLPDQSAIFCDSIHLNGRDEIGAGKRRALYRETQIDSTASQLTHTGLYGNLKTLSISMLDSTGSGVNGFN
jgi:hypothetical protein